MRHLGITLGLASTALLLSLPARADRVVLTGGTVLEGKVIESGTRVRIRVESGEVTVPRTAVARIETEDASALETLEARRSALRDGDVSARLALAAFCRDHDLGQRERELLREVLALAPDNPVARGRLGYVKAGGSWVSSAEVTRADAAEARARAAERDAADADARARAAERDTAEAELRLQKADLDARGAELDRRARELDTPRSADAAPTYPLTYVAYPIRGFVPPRPGRCRDPGGCPRHPEVTPPVPAPPPPAAQGNPATASDPRVARHGRRRK